MLEKGLRLLDEMRGARVFPSSYTLRIMKMWNTWRLSWAGAIDWECCAVLRTMVDVVGAAYQMPGGALSKRPRLVGSRAENAEEAVAASNKEQLGVCDVTTLKKFTEVDLDASVAT